LEKWFSPSQPEFGVTFSSLYSEKLGLNPQETYLALLHDLQIKKIRLPIYWSEIEPLPGEFDWQMTDFFVAEAEKSGVNLTLAIGRKVPRWPECFIPDWAEALEYNQGQDAVLNMEQKVVERYKNSPAVERWQVENEPFFPFGICPAPDKDFFLEEVALVHELDNRPIVVTVSGEMDPWILNALSGDVLGVSMYRLSWNGALGLFPFPFVPSIYRARSWLTGFFVDQVIVSELQAEPWFVKPIEELTSTERATAFTAEDLKNNLEFARQSGFSEVYLWGAEWWYAEKLEGRDELWETAKKFIK